MKSVPQIDGEARPPTMLDDISRWSQVNLRYVADLILPPICVYCRVPLSDHGVLCASCWRDIEFITPPLCDRLGSPLHYSDYSDDGLRLSAMARRHPPDYRRGRAVARFNGVMRDLIHGFKYSDRHEAVRMFARMMQAAGAELLAEADIIMPVPLHRRKLFKRRFNQAAILAQRLSALTGLPADLSSLKRVRQTNSQVGLAQIERRANVDAAFAVNPRDAAKIGGKTVLLIDDVITTGATLNACTRVLLKAGAANVDCLAIAMVGGMTETS